MQLIGSCEVKQLLHKQLKYTQHTADAVQSNKVSEATEDFYNLGPKSS